MAAPDRILAVAVAAAVLAGSCSGDDEPDGVDEPTESLSPSTRSANTDTVDEGELLAEIALG